MTVRLGVSVVSPVAQKASAAGPRAGHDLVNECARVLPRKTSKNGRFFSAEEMSRKFGWMTLIVGCLTRRSATPQALLPIEFGQSRTQELTEENARLKQRIAELVAGVHIDDFVPEDRRTNGTAARAASPARSMLDQARLLSIGGPKRQVILTFVNKARLDFAATWSASVRRLGLTNWMVGATDATALRHLLETGVPCFDLHTSLPEGEWAWGSANFHSIGPTKV